MADTVPAMLEPGEYVIRKDAAEEIGIDNLNMLNNVDRSSQMYMNHGGLVPQLQHGHSAIDELLAINTLSNQANVDMTRQTGMFNKGGEAESKTLKDMVDPYLPRKEDMLPYLELITGASAKTEDYSPGAVDLALSIPLLGGAGRGIKKGIQKLAKKFSKNTKIPKHKYFLDEATEISEDSMERIRKRAGDPDIPDMWGVKGKYPAGRYTAEIEDVLYDITPSGKYIPRGYKGPNITSSQKGYDLDFTGPPIDKKDWVRMVKNGKDQFGKDFNRGGEVPQKPDPLQIDARMRGEFKNMGTIGAVDSNKYYSNLLNEAMQDREMLEKASFLEGYAPSEEKIKQDIFKALDYFSRKHKASPKVQGYNNGGTVGYGDQTSNVMTLEDIYEQYGQRPDDASGFQEYDVSREGGALADYSRQVSGLQQQGMGMIGKATQQAQGMGGGFAGFGGRQSAIDQTRTQAQRGYQAGIDQAQQNKFETIRSMREGYQADIIGQLAQEESMEGTSGYTKPAEVVQSLPTSDQGDVEYNGTRYVWDKQKGGYVTAQEYQQDDMSDYYDQYDYA